MLTESMMESPEKVELFLSCRNIINMAYPGRNNIKIKLYSHRDGQYHLCDETETIHNSDNPDFTKTFVLEYHFEVTQKVKFEIVHMKGAQQGNIIGEIFTTLGEIVGMGQKVMNSGFDIMHNGSKTGKLMIKFEKVAINNSTVVLGFSAQIPQISGSWLQFLDVFGFFSSSNHVLKLYRITNDFDYALIYESEVIQNTLDPVWPHFEIKISKLCNSDHFRPIKARIYSRYGEQDTLIGECQFTLDEIMNHNTRRFNLKASNSTKQTGTLSITHFRMDEKFNFLDYIRGDVQLNVMVAIDFTGSNGDPDLETSLHALKFDGTLNEYQKAIMSVCSILLNYDYDKKVLMYGFGGKPRFPQYMSNVVQHCFPLTGDPHNPWAYNLSGIMDTYKYALNNVVLSGPTLFTPILSEAMKVAQINKANGSKEYTILLIITDGEIHDMEPTINSLIKSADLPLSVIIVGVGSADFGNMTILDGDDGLYNSEGTKAERDLVQFVPFKEFQNNPEELAKHVLEEVPNQLVEYMARQKIKPHPMTLFSMSQSVGHLGQIQPAFQESRPRMSSEISRDEISQYASVVMHPKNVLLNFEQKENMGAYSGDP